MEFKRYEVRRILRHNESVHDADEIRRIFDDIQKAKLKFSIQVKDMGGQSECSVMSLGESKVRIWSRKPAKLDIELNFSEILGIEVEANCDIGREEDGGGRWANLV